MAATATYTPPAPPFEQHRFATGAMLGERFRIVGLLGRGGMGEVFRADDLTLGQPVALKFLPHNLALDAGRLAQFHTEVRTARQVAHPNVCRIYDIGSVGGQHFLSMEYVDGEDLASLLRRIGRLSSDKAVDLARQVCAGLAAAHDRGVLHRDLKPANIMVDGRGKVRIADFGLARAAGEVHATGAIEGTPAYMAPEQFAGREQTARSDLYALGLVLYEMFTGKPAFSAGSLVELARLHREESPSIPTTLVRDLDPAVERIILRCLEKDPAARPASALAVAAALPGGDPLAAALAAGETPSPEMVAAAGENRGIDPRLAWGGFAVVVAALAAFALLAPRLQLFGVVPMPKSPDSLADRAREIVVRLGYDEPPRDSAHGFIYSDYLNHLRKSGRSREVREKLRIGQPPALLFWYRQSPRILTSTDYVLPGRVTLDQPPPLVSGMVSVQLDPKGRLVKLDAVPRQDAPVAAAPRPAEWSPLFVEAGFDPGRFTPAVSDSMPPVYADSRAAWEGVYPDQPSISVRVEAASAAGKPVYFQVFEPWSRPRLMEEQLPSAGPRAKQLSLSVVLLAILAGTILLARRNLGLGRGDRRGAFRFSLYVLAAVALSTALGAKFAGDLDALVGLGSLILSRSLLSAGMVWLGYLALEPHVRRLWPHTIIGWSRLLAGGVRDPLVGRDLLVGTIAALVVGLLRAGLRMRDPIPRTGHLEPLLGLRGSLAITLNDQVYAILVGLFSFLGLFLIRLVVRRVWIAAAVLVIFTMVGNALSAPSPAVGAVHGLIAGMVPVLILLRFGLLAHVAQVWVANVILGSPQNVDLASWYWASSLFPYLVVLALGFYSARIAAGGRTLFRTDFLNE
jgi:serine/threonine-protein kinase